MLALKLKLTPCRGGRRKPKPAVFTWSGDNEGTKRIQFSDTVKIRTTGTVEFGIADKTIKPEDGWVKVDPTSAEYQVFTIKGDGGFEISHANRVSHLYLRALGSSVITGDITGMKLTYLYLRALGSSVITGDITGMELTYLYLSVLGSSVITGDITGMKLTYLTLNSIGSSVITGDITGMKLTFLTLNIIGSSAFTGDITGMELTALYINSIGSSLTYGTNSLNITNTHGIQLLGDTVFATADEYERLIQDAANGTWGGAHPFVITAGTNDNCPDWDTVKAYVAILLEKAAWTIIPSAWLEDNDGTWPTNWNEYTGE